MADLIAGGWQVSGIFLAQSGPFLTPTQGGSADPSGTGTGNYRTQRPDRIGKGSLSNQTVDQWFDKSAFVCAGQQNFANKYSCTVGAGGTNPAPIGRFGNSGVGILNGPNSVTLSMGFGKSFVITERVRAFIQGTYTNILDRTNYSNPNTTITSSSFGRITSASSSDFGGNRTGQVAVRLQF